MTTRAWILSGLAAAVVAQMAVAAEPKERVAERAEEWERAAENRFVAGVVQLEESERLLLHAQKVREEEYGDPAKRRKAFDSAGQLERKAGDTAGLACVNLEKAADNWIKASTDYKEAGRAEQARTVEERANEAAQEAVRSARLAAHAYERSADAFSVGKADNPTQEAASSEKAAVWRERIASKK
jgi:hypothetical protein